MIYMRIPSVLFLKLFCKSNTILKDSLFKKGKIYIQGLLIKLKYFTADYGYK